MNELKKGQNSSVYPKTLNVEQRTKLIKKVETLMVQPLTKQFNNVIFFFTRQRNRTGF